MAKTEAQELTQVIFWDCTDVMSFAKRGRRFTGIQRVVYELGRALRLTAGVSVRYFAFDNQRKTVKLVQDSEFDRLNVLGARRSRLQKASEKIASSINSALHRTIKVEEGVAAELADPDACVVSAGVGWADGNLRTMFRALDARLARRIKLAVVVYDIIPIETPGLARKKRVVEFRDWFDFIRGRADLALSISDATAKSVLREAPDMSARIARNKLGVTPIQADGSFGIDSPNGFIVYVSTVNARKNHRMAIKAWSLAFRDSVETAPDLVFVGHCKPAGEKLLKELVEIDGLKRKLRFYTTLGDAEMASLVRDAAFFIYPSHREGWGLPVEEALSLGKFGIVSDSSSLPEAGAGFVAYANPDDVEEWARLLRFYWTNKAVVLEMERKIAAEYRITDWRACAAGLARTIRERVTEERESPEPLPKRLHARHTPSAAPVTLDPR